MTYTKEFFERGFNPVIEANFLRRLTPGVRGKVLETEIRTAAYEAFLVEFKRDYKWKEGRIYDEQSGLYILDLTKNGDRPEEILAMEAIESGLGRGKMMVNFSPKNIKYDYPQNCVDFWRREGEKITWLRFVTKNEYEDLAKVWAEIGGEGEVSDEFGLLSKPVATEEKLADVLSKLDFVKGKNEIGAEDIDAIVEKLAIEFKKEFGETEILTPDKIFRLFSAVMAEVKSGKKVGWSLIDISRVDRYLHGQIRLERVKTGGCAGFNTLGQFGPGQGYYVVGGGEGMKVMSGMVPEGYKYCKKCGVWYSGQKCPFCD